MLIFDIITFEKLPSFLLALTWLALPPACAQSYLTEITQIKANGGRVDWTPDSGYVIAFDQLNNGKVEIYVTALVKRNLCPAKSI